MDTKRSVYRCGVSLPDGRTIVVYLPCQSAMADANVLCDTLRAAVIAIETEDCIAMLCSHDASLLDAKRAKRALDEDAHQHRPADKVAPVGMPCPVPTSFRSVGGQS